MFDIFFGWRKASRCKKLIKQVQCRLKLLKNKRYTMVKQLREDVAELIKLGYEESAFNRVEQIFKDENIMPVYDILDNYCEFLTINLSYIRRNKDCPNDINEAVSSLIFASARCGDLPELHAIRRLFEERYGQRFATGAVESYPGNLVNREVVKEKLSINSVPDDVKDRLVDEIIKEYCLRPDGPGLLAIEYPSELQQQDEENIPTSNDKVEESPVQNSDGIEIEENSMYVEPTSMTESVSNGPFQSQSLQNSDVITASVSCSVLQQSSPDVMESPVMNKEEKGANFGGESGFESEVGSIVDTESQGSDRNVTTTLKHKDKRLRAVSSSESLTQFFGETVVYLDDIEDIQSSVTQEGSFQDQRLLKFKSLIPPKTGGIISEFSDGSYMDRYEEVSEISGSWNLWKSSNEDIKRPRRRSISGEISIVQETDHDIYYEKPSSHKHRSHNRRKLQKNATAEENVLSSYRQKIMKQRGHMNNCQYNARKSCCNFSFNSDMNVCSLEHACYFCPGNEKDEKEAPPWQQKRAFINLEQFPITGLEENSGDYFCQSSRYGGSSNEMEWTKVEQTALPQNLRRRSYANGEKVYVVFTWPNKQKEKTKNQSLPSSLRAMTMPQERPKHSQKDIILRSNSCNLQYPNHVHPKLPDCDEIAAKFMALKKEYMQNKL